jgi:Holliday junction resolvase RusA-like endonuclease
MARVAFTVYGKPATAGSKRGFVYRKSGRVIVTDANANSRPWKAQVADAAAQAMTYHDADGTSGYRPPLEGPLLLQLIFWMPRPKGHIGRRGNVLPSAPAAPAVRPDLLKLARAVEDALTLICYRDDAQITCETLQKAYTAGSARVDVRIVQVQA